MNNGLDTIFTVWLFFEISFFLIFFSKSTFINGRSYYNYYAQASSESLLDSRVEVISDRPDIFNDIEEGLPHLSYWHF